VKNYCPLWWTRLGRGGGTPLSADDQLHLQRLGQTLQLVRDRTEGVVKGFSNGFFLHGRGGTGKTYTVTQELARLRASYHLSNSRVSGRGLVDILEQHPDAVHVIEDAETMMNDKAAVGVLRSALWGQEDGGSQERWVTWTVSRPKKEFPFTGGVIVISNRPLPDLPELEALKTRVPTLLLEPTDNELRALMRQIAAGGYEWGRRRMDADECHEVCEFLISESAQLHGPLDVRLLVRAFRDYLQFEAGHAGSHWKNLVATAVRGQVTTLRGPVQLGSRADRKQAELDTLRDILASTNDRQERLRLWQERTGKSEKSLYRRLAELRADSHVLTFPTY
jgi:hypothetical protein